MSENKPEDWANIADRLRHPSRYDYSTASSARALAADLCERYARGELVERIETSRDEYCSGRRAGHVWSLKTGVCMYCDTRKPWP